jgi:HEPN domain-containing protein
MTPTGKRPPPGSPEDWLAHAWSDLNLARLARDNPGVLPEQACFHAQQAAEKALKAVFVSQGVDFPLVHSIHVLVQIAQESGLEVPPEVDEARLLTPYAVLTGYPGYLEEISAASVSEAIRLAERVVCWAAERIADQGGGRGVPDDRPPSGEGVPS